jgi:LDH2 family malate/lactate/ureidoglycolate dehydrogenase
MRVIALDVASLATADEMTTVVDSILADLRVRYPGERALDARRRSVADGIPVDPSIWQVVQTYV